MASTPLFVAGQKRMGSGEEEEKKIDQPSVPANGVMVGAENMTGMNFSQNQQLSVGLPPFSAANQAPPQNAQQAVQTLLAANALATGSDSNSQALLAAAAQAQQAFLEEQAQTAALLTAATAPFTHNLIPSHLQASALASPLNGSPGYPSALIPPPALGGLHVPNAHSNLSVPQATEAPASLPSMTVQDRPNVTPIYNGINPHYPGVRVVNADPPIFCVDNFLTPLECQFLVTFASDSFGPAPVVGKGAGEVSPSRTSSTCYLAREDLPDYMRKVSMLTGKPIEHCELPQVGRYLPSQQYLQHFDAFDTSTEDGRRFASNGGQRTITVLVYLNDVMRGGATRFPALNLDVQPRQGMALVFFPATVDGCLDRMALHAALPAVDTKYVSQVWIRQGPYNGQPSKRLPQTMGAPFNPPLGSAPAPQPLAHAQPVTSTSNTVLANPLAAESSSSMTF
jgi:prolyl 4-hydroxylase